MGHFDDLDVPRSMRAPDNPCRCCCNEEAIIECSFINRPVCRACWQRQAAQIVTALLGSSQLAPIVREIDVSRFGVTLRMFPTSKEPDPRMERLHAEMLVPDRDQQRWIVVTSRNLIDVSAPEFAVVGRVFDVVMSMVKHELSEQFRYRGGLPFDPHR